MFLSLCPCLRFVVAILRVPRVAGIGEQPLLSAQGQSMSAKNTRNTDHSHYFKENGHRSPCDYKRQNRQYKSSV